MASEIHVRSPWWQGFVEGRTSQPGTKDWTSDVWWE